MSLHVVILAAGQGKRMYSNTPKVLHTLGGQPMLSRVVHAARGLNPAEIHVVIGHGGSLIRSALPELAVNWVVQEEQLGTGHAVLQALTDIPTGSDVLILCADVPLIQTETLQALIKQHTLGVTLLVATVPNPFGLGRIIRDDAGQIQAIMEEKDASSKEREIKEIYSGICCAKVDDLARWLPNLSRNNAQGEYYLTEIIEMADTISSYSVPDYREIQGVNNRLQLQESERIWQGRIASGLMLSGVALADASRIDIRGELRCGKDVFIDVNSVFLGTVVLGDGCNIGPNCVLQDVTLGAHCDIYPNSVLEHCSIGNNGQIGPFARLRPGTQLASNCKIGNFVETKNAVFGHDSKASHLSYLGDVSIGNNVNIGAGTITCNYDGVNKHKTIIEDGAFIGSDTQLIAPVTVGENATIGAGSTIRKNVPADKLTLTESRQKTVEGWSRPKKS